MDTISPKRLFLFIDLVLIAVAVYLGVKGIYAVGSSLLDTLPPAATTRATATPIRQVELPPYSDYRAIAQRNLFHTTTVAGKASESIALDNLEETELKLKLSATFAFDNPENSYAIIEDESKRGEQKSYKINDTIQNATIKMILADKVVLSVSGRDEVLQLQKRSGSTSTSASTRTTTTASVQATTGTDTATTTTISLTRAQVDSAMDNLTELMTQITIQPYNEDGLEGLALSEIQPNSIFRRMGLRNGDVLVAVEGQPLTSVDQALQLYENLKSSDAASVEINRRGRSRIIQYKIR